MTSGTKFKFSEHHYRKSFFENLPGANEMRFVKFNDMPS